MNYRNRILKVALTQYGVTEVKGAEDNPRIIHYFNYLGYNGKELHDETAWCSAFIAYCAKYSGLEHSTKLYARSWAEIGKPSGPVNPFPEDERDVCGNMGDVCIFWRGKSQWDKIKGTDIHKGHVALYIHETDDDIFVLGGNQSNKVCILPYPKERLITVRTLGPWA